MRRASLGGAPFLESVSAVDALAIGDGDRTDRRVAGDEPVIIIALDEYDCAEGTNIVGVVAVLGGDKSALLVNHGSDKVRIAASAAVDATEIVRAIRERNAAVEQRDHCDRTGKPLEGAEVGAQGGHGAIGCDEGDCDCQQSDSGQDVEVAELKAGDAAGAGQAGGLKAIDLVVGFLAPMSPGETLGRRTLGAAQIIVLRALAQAGDRIRGRDRADQLTEPTLGLPNGLFDGLGGTDARDDGRISLTRDGDALFGAGNGDGGRIRHRIHTLFQFTSCQISWA